MYRKLKKLRIEHNLTQKQIADILGISQTGYSKYEMGSHRVPSKVLVNIAKYYGVSVDYLVGLTDETRPYPTPVTNK